MAVIVPVGRLFRLLDKVAPGLAVRYMKEGPDPVVGAGLVIVGILIMGIGGAATAHYLFNLGSVIAILGAVYFVAAVALSTYRDRGIREAEQNAQGNASAVGAKPKTDGTVAS